MHTEAIHKKEEIKIPDIIVLTIEAIHSLASGMEVVCPVNGGKILIMSQMRYLTAYAAEEKENSDE